MSGRMNCAFEALVIDQHAQLMKNVFDSKMTHEQRQQYVDELEAGRPDYSGMTVEPQWHVFRAAWVLSREALSIKLPPRASPILFQDRPIFSMSGEGRNAALDEVRAVIEAQGVAISE